MASYEYKRIYHPKLGRFVYKHKGSGLIVDNIFKPVGRVLSKVPEMVLKPLAKKALQSGISHAGDKLGKAASEKSGELIMRKLHGSTKQSMNETMKPTKPTKPKQEEDYNTILNRLISGTGLRR